MAIPLILVVALIVYWGVHEYTSTDGRIRRLMHHELEFPVLQEPLATDMGHRSLFGELAEEGDCLRVTSPDRPDVTVLPIWPPGYSLDASRMEVLSYSGRVAARMGDDVRLCGRGVPLKELPELREHLGVKCPPPYFLVGDDVSIIGRDEHSVVELPGSSLYFPRSPHYLGFQVMELVLHVSGLGLRGGCLVLESPAGAAGLVVWPPGFWPQWDEDGLVVWNGGGTAIARPGDRFAHGRRPTPPDSPFVDREKCPGYDLWYIQGIRHEIPGE